MDLHKLKEMNEFFNLLKDAGKKQEFVASVLKEKEDAVAAQLAAEGAVLSIAKDKKDVEAAAVKNASDKAKAEVQLADAAKLAAELDEKSAALEALKQELLAKVRAHDAAVEKDSKELQRKSAAVDAREKAANKLFAEALEIKAEFEAKVESLKKSLGV